MAASVTFSGIKAFSALMIAAIFDNSILRRLSAVPKDPYFARRGATWITRVRRSASRSSSDPIPARDSNSRRTASSAFLAVMVSGSERKVIVILGRFGWQVVILG